MTTLNVLKRFSAVVASGTRSCYSSTCKNLRIDKNTKVICQGITTEDGAWHIKDALEYGTKMVGGTSAECNDHGLKMTGLTVFESVAKAKAETGANASVIFEPPGLAARAIMEAISAEIGLIVCTTRDVPQEDMTIVRRAISEQSKSRLLGPYSAGIIAPGKCNIGTLPQFSPVHKPGCVGIISRSVSLSYEAARQTSEHGLGQSLCISLGRDQFLGTDFVDCLKVMLECPETKGIIMIGEIGTSMEEKAARFLRDNNTGPNAKPVVAFIDGMDAPMDYRSSAEEKIESLEEAGVIIAKRPDVIGYYMMEGIKSKGTSKQSKKMAV